MKNNRLSITSILIITLSTLAYWYWESLAEGNIRIDLFIIYPALFVIYSIALWRRFGFYTILVSSLIMLINIIYFVYSYELFDKYRG